MHITQYGTQSCASYTEAESTYTCNDGRPYGGFVVERVEGIAQRALLQLDTPIQLIILRMEKEGFLKAEKSSQWNSRFASEDCDLWNDGDECADLAQYSA